MSPRRWAAALAIVITLSLLQGCSQGPKRFADLDSFVTRLNLSTMDEVILDEESGEETVMNNPGPTIEVLVVGSARSARRDITAALRGAGCERPVEGAYSFDSQTAEYLVRPTYVPAGSQLPSGAEVPPGTTGVFLSMG